MDGHCLIAYTCDSASVSLHLGAGSTACKWAEEILYNEPVVNVLRPNALLLFEVFDLGPHVRLDRHPDGVRPLCWAFLRVLSQRGATMYCFYPHQEAFVLFYVEFFFFFVLFPYPARQTKLWHLASAAVRVRRRRAHAALGAPSAAHTHARRVL